MRILILLCILLCLVGGCDVGKRITRDLIDDMEETNFYIAQWGFYEGYKKCFEDMKNYRDTNIDFPNNEKLNIYIRKRFDEMWEMFQIRLETE